MDVKNLDCWGYLAEATSANKITFKYVNFVKKVSNAAFMHQLLMYCILKCCTYSAYLIQNFGQY